MIGKEVIIVTPRTLPKCEEFLKIKWPGEEYKTIDKFIELHKDVSQKELDSCQIIYREREKTYKEFINEYVAFSVKLEFVQFNSFSPILNKSINVSRYFIRKSIDCLENARFFTIKSSLILDEDCISEWNSGYTGQYMLRCLYFDTAVTWYSNAFDQLLQSVYWAYELYKDAVDRDKNLYVNSWEVKKTLEFCTYDFVVKDLRKKGMTKVRKMLTSCSGKIEEVRKWANYIKHKGGVDYKYLEPEDPLKIYIQSQNNNKGASGIDERFMLENFKSPIKIDIDAKLSVLAKAHKALYSCITSVMTEIDYEQYRLSLGGSK